MKKFFAIILAASMMLSFAACGKTDGNNSEAGTSNVNSVEENKSVAENSLALLNKIWASYADDEKFPAAGGDYTEENNTMDAPGKFGIEDAAGIDSMLGFPEVSVGKIDDAASLMHMMNANTFTSGVYHVKDYSDVASLSEEIKKNILARQWMCGFPEKLIIFNIDDYIISAFGKGNNIELFKQKTTSVYGSAKVYCEENIE